MGFPAGLWNDKDRNSVARCWWDCIVQTIVVLRSADVTSSPCPLRRSFGLSRSHTSIERIPAFSGLELAQPVLHRLGPWTSPDTGTRIGSTRMTGVTGDKGGLA